MLFKTASIGQQYPGLHPELRRVLGELEQQLKEWGLPEPTITEANRTPEEQEEIYWRILSHRAEGRVMKDVPEAEARMLARHKFTYHFVSAAADLRVADPDRALAWLQGHLRKEREDFEMLVHDVVGRHLHVAFRDRVARKLYEQADNA